MKARLALYEELEESVKAEAPRRVMSAIKGVDDVIEVTSRVNHVLTEGAIAETADDLHRLEFTGDLGVMEQLEVYTRAEIPERWRDFFDGVVRDDAAAGRAVVAETAKSRALLPNWRLDHDQLWENRHRRRIPISDDALRARIAQHVALGWY